MIPGSGDHGECVKDGVIVGATQRYRTVVTKATIDKEGAQSCGFPIDPANADAAKRYSGGGETGDFDQLFYDCGKYNYSRLPNTMSPDRSTQ
jgi:hypothetical protein